MMDAVRAADPTDGLRPEAPLILAFENPRGPGGEALLDGLFGHLARDPNRPFGLLRLREGRGAGYFRGIAGLGETVDEVASALASQLAGSVHGEVIAFGEGLGGLAALVFGILLGASRIVAVEPVAHLVATELERFRDRRWREELAAIPDPSAAEEARIPGLIARTDFRGRIAVLFGTARQDENKESIHLNAVHAQWLALSDRVTLHPMPDAGPGVLSWLVGRDDGLTRLSRHLFEGVPGPSFDPTFAPPDPESLKGEKRYFYNPRLTLCTAKDAGGGAGPGGEVRFTAAGEVDTSATRKVTDEWRRWIAENLILDATTEEVTRVLKAGGISEREATLEIDRARFSPYMKGSRLLKDRFRKRDWQLATYRKLHRLAHGGQDVVRRHRPSRPEFLAESYSTGRPVILTGLIDDWPALSQWGIDSLRRTFGDREVEVRYTRKAPPGKGASESSARRLRFSDFLTMLDAGPAEDLSSSLTADDGSPNQAALRELWDDIVPLREYLDARDHAGSFRMEPPGAASPFEGGAANCLVAQVLGRSHVRVIPSWDLPLMGKTPKRVAPLRGRAAGPASGEPQVLDCTLAPGEILFLPVGSLRSFKVLETSATVSFANFAFANDFPPVPGATSAF